MKYIKRIVIIVLVLTVAFGGAVYYYEDQAVKQLMALGYDKTQAAKLVEVTNMFDIDDTQRLSLETTVNEFKTKIEQEVGIALTELPVTESMVLVEQAQVLETFYLEQKATHEGRLTELLSYVSQHPVTIVEEGSLIERYFVNYDQTKAYLINQAIEAGGIQSKVNERVNDEDPIGTLTALQTLKEEIEYDKEVNGFYFEREAAMEMFRQVNEYRASQGLAPYTYNDAQQECVDVESTAYATNKVPHNWLCKAANNENAGISSVNSNYVKIAMDFFITDPPHHAVLVGNYRSAAVSIVIKGGVAYMILDVFN